MANFKRVILAGNLTRDPQLSMLPSNTPVCDFGMAINRKWKSQSGEMRDDTCFVDMRIYGRRAEVINQYMSKGRCGSTAVRTNSVAPQAKSTKAGARRAPGGLRTPFSRSRLHAPFLRARARGRQRVGSGAAYP